MKNFDIVRASYYVVVIVSLMIIGAALIDFLF